MKRIKRAVAVLLAVMMVFSGETNQVRMKFVEIRMVNTQLV